MSGAVAGAYVGVDVGGTFTDAVLWDADGCWRAKVPTTPDDIGRGILHACDAVATRSRRPLGEVLVRTERFGLGTTVVTNMLATRSGRRVGLLTTRGFEDLVPIARGALVSEGGWLVPPSQLVARDRIIGIDERVGRDGRIVRALDPVEVVAAARELVDEHGVEALAVSFLWSFREPAHEEAAVKALHEALPGLPVTSGAALAPAIREYERTMAALLNAYVVGSLDPVASVADELAARGLRVPILLVHSNGGTLTLSEARRQPAALVGSGPAAGVAAAAAIAPEGRLVTCDMGGTSLDIGLVRDGQPSRASRGPAMGFWTSTSRLEIASIGAGGGSVAWRDARGMLRVGPRSAGAEPGPACYAAGGTDPTVTDALVVLGYLDPDRFLDGERNLDATAARGVCADLGAALGLGAVEAAWGIREVALASMAKAVRRELAIKGLDPRTHTLVGFGGCAGLFACDLARAIGARRVLMPGFASVLSAFGAATTDVRRERVRSIASLVPVRVRDVVAYVRDLTADVGSDLAADGIASVDRTVRVEADLRFKRQTSELTVMLDERDEPLNDVLVERFRAEYAARYGEAAMMRDAPIELVTLRAVGVGRTRRPEGGRTSRTAVPGLDTVARTVHVGRESGADVEVTVISGGALALAGRVEGPTIVDEGDTRIWLPAGAAATVDERGALAVEVGP